MSRPGAPTLAEVRTTETLEDRTLLTGEVPIAGLPDGPVAEGQTITLTAELPPGADPAGFAWTHTYRNKTRVLAAGTGETFTFAALNQGSYTVSVVGTDAAGATVAGAVDFEAANVPPVVLSLTGPAGASLPGEEVVVTARVYDPGVIDRISPSWARYRVLPDGTEDRVAALYESEQAVSSDPAAPTELTYTFRALDEGEVPGRPDAVEPVRAVRPDDRGDPPSRWPSRSSR